MATVLIADDHQVVRIAVRMLLEREGHNVVGEAADGHEALQLVRSLNPELVIVDIEMPKMGGLELIEKLRAGEYRGGLLVMTGRGDDHYLHRCIGVGADGFFNKGGEMDILSDAVRSILRGYGYFPLNRQPGIEDDIVKSLSNRELQVLKMIAKGKRVIEISQEMYVSTKTISTYKRRILTKLDLDTTLGLVDFARRHNLDS
ncbi:response regulator transcription factor [Enterobacter mori]|uniref:response regulator transcription factor n=1 Tax=Enterobacter mori TaxID=539813 RepID=UPI002B2168DD|nr:response regulator transcription factor [Enterobacter mori]MEA5206341.1 response regulator transcription factor [Enterobacter mori]